jgi:hypothetical protein
MAKTQPKQLEEKEINGKPCIFIGTEWVELKSKTEKVARDNSRDVPVELKIGEMVLKGIAIPKTFEHSGRNGYTFVINRGQILFGNGNLFA